MSFSVDKLLTQASQFASPGRFLFRLAGAVDTSHAHPPGFLKVGGREGEGLPRPLAEGLLCHQVTLPTRAIATADEFRHGPPRKIATQVNFGDLDASFYWMGANAVQCRQVHGFFNKWHNYIVGRVDDGTISGYNQMSYYGPAFYDNYTMDAELKVYSPNSTDTSDAVATFRFFELYPLTLNPIQFSWDNADNVLSFNISFTFRAWESV